MAAPPRKGQFPYFLHHQDPPFQRRFHADPIPGENYELRRELNSEYRDKRADAIKRVIANHTIGKDCSGLFPDVVKNMVRPFHLFHLST